ncbi:MAG: HAMP domain-containing histidine kinase [Armatimonadetes bacterium]|nr:HAMP domain-containing histidine kinase [Armatimonadota bacterium]
MTGLKPVAMAADDSICSMLRSGLSVGPKALAVRLHGGWGAVAKAGEGAGHAAAQQAASLLETMACLAAAGHGPEAAFTAAGRYIVARLGVEAAVLVEDREGGGACVVAAVPSSLLEHLPSASVPMADWLARAIAGGQASVVLSEHDDPLASALRERGLAAAAVAPVSADKGRRLLMIAASSRPLSRSQVEALGGLAGSLEAGRRAGASQEHRAPMNAAAAAVCAEQMKAVTQLAASLAHELNNALAAILGQAELLLEELGTDPRAERVKRISGRTVQLMTLARSLEEYASAQLVGQIEDCDLGELAQAAVETTRCVWEAEARARGCRIDMQCEIEADAPVRVVASQVKRSLVHIIFNAIQAIGDRDGLITVRTWQDGVFAACSVTDNGVGMPPDVLRRCREPFFTTRPGVCKGLGLSLAEAVARGHGGDLEVSSTPGRGTTVTMYLPLRI